MRITSNGVPLAPDGGAVNGVAPVAGIGAGGAVNAGAAGAAGAAAPLQSAVFQPALAAMADLPEIDNARVAELRDAIGRGELHFDAAKLAGLIQRYHGSRG